MQKTPLIRLGKLAARFKAANPPVEYPTEPPRSGKYVYPRVSHEPRMQHLSDAIAKQGLHPFRMK